MGGLNPMSLFTFYFLVFLFSAALVYYLSPHRFRWAILLLASGIFYLTYSRVFAVILGIVILVNYFAGLRLASLPENKRGGLLWAGILFNIGLLLSYKFLGPWLGTSIPFIRDDPMLMEFTLLPLGLSFHALQAVSYLVEVSRGGHEAERHAGIFALSILFFPRVLSGPIEKPNLLDQFKTEAKFDYNGVTEGMKILAWGFFKKLVIADRLTALVNQAYGNPTAYSGVSLFYTTVAFAFALYADFSGYSDIAVGAARVFGIKLIQNFNHPYSARSISEFWQRWHVSLSNWLRDYIFFPVRRFLLRQTWARRVPLLATVIPPLVTMLASGIWHGTGWTYLVWGGLHGLYLVFFQLTEGVWQRVGNALRLDRLPKLTAFIQQGVTFTLVTLALILFRANTLADAFYIFTHLLQGMPHYLVASAQDMAAAISTMDRFTIYRASLRVMSPLTLDSEFGGFIEIVSFFAIILLEWMQFSLARISTKPAALRWATYAFLIAMTLYFSVAPSVDKQFIYFQF
jgi:D-alanyl-lipoteichoic acid acyltransferase DltB (MBOAT superfamily)